jgi:delta14-sterol reductase
LRYQWFIGRELNPTFLGLDIKSFNELRPGMILWYLINISMACEQSVRRGGSITDSMWLVIAFQAWYVFDALYNEPAMFSTMDITSDGFGFMLSVGDLVWVPFVYSLQARYLAWHPVELGPAWTAAIFTLHGLGYYIFRSSNGEKNEFRNGKNPKGLAYIETKRGTKLLTSGWWGMSRHPNYWLVTFLYPPISFSVISQGRSCYGSVMVLTHWV